jgi:hypothetical protein
MWPFKSKIPSLTSVSRNGENITLIHKSGVYNFNEAEIVKTSYSSDFFSKEKYYNHLTSGIDDINWFFPNSKKFRTANTFWFFLLFGGMLNMLTSFFPFLSFYAKKIENISISGDFETTHKFILVFSAFILTYLLFAFSIFLLKKNRISLNKDYYEEDVLSIWTNSQFIKVRINETNDPFLYYDTKTESIEPKHWFQDNKKVWIPTLLILFVVLIFTKYNTPFWFYNVNSSEDFLGSLFNSDQPFRYWSYYSDYQIYDNNSWSITHNVNPFIAFYDGMVSNFLLVISIPFLYLFFAFIMAVLSLGVFLVLGPVIPSFKLFNRMLGDGREIYKVYKKYGKFLGLLWIVLFFEFFYFHQIELVWFISLLVIALVLEFFRIKAFKKIESNTEFYFSISKYKKERGQEIYPQLFMALYIPILLAFILLLIPISVPYAPHTSDLFGVRVAFIIMISFAPLGFITWLQFIGESNNYGKPDRHIFKYLSRNRKDLKSWVFVEVERNGLNLQFASEELKNDKEIVLKAIKSNKEAIQYASEELKNDPEIIEVLNDEKEQ